MCPDPNLNFIRGVFVESLVVVTSSAIHWDLGTTAVPVNFKVTNVRFLLLGFCPFFIHYSEILISDYLHKITSILLSFTIATYFKNEDYFSYYET